MQDHNTRRLFIVGVGRSGTSLLQSMLNAHPRICFPPETSFIRRFLVTDSLRRMWEDDPGSVAKVLGDDELIGRLALDEGAIDSILSSLGGAFSVVELYVRLLEAYAAEAGKADAAWIGDKDPRSVEYLPLIHRCFPEARILHIIRDPRDVLASKKKAAWSKNQSSFRHVFANRVQLKMGREQGRRLFGPNYMEFAYEELLGNANRVLTRISRLLDLDFHPAMLEFSDSSKRLVSQDEMQWKKETLGPLLATNSGKWKDSLASWETALTERVCGEAFRAMNYEKEAGRCGLRLTERLLLPAAQVLMAASDPIYRLYRKIRVAK